MGQKWDGVGWGGVGDRGGVPAKKTTAPARGSFTVSSRLGMSSGDGVRPTVMRGLDVPGRVPEVRKASLVLALVLAFWVLFCSAAMSVFGLYRMLLMYRNKVYVL